MSGRATPGELVAKLADVPEASWGTIQAYKADLGSKSKDPVIFNDQSAYFSLRPLILAELAAEAAKVEPDTLTSKVLRQRVMALAQLDTTNARHVNFFAWALAKLVQERQVEVLSLPGPRGGMRKWYVAK